MLIKVETQDHVTSLIKTSTYVHTFDMHIRE
jgi:hypothetical protein